METEKLMFCDPYLVRQQLYVCYIGSSLVTNIKETDRWNLAEPSL